MEKPGDVYTFVANMVEERVKIDAADSSNKNYEIA